MLQNCKHLQACNRNGPKQGNSKLRLTFHSSLILVIYHGALDWSVLWDTRCTEHSQSTSGCLEDHEASWPLNGSSWCGQTLKLSLRTVGRIFSPPMEPLSSGGDNFREQSEQSGYKESLRPLKAVGLPVLHKENYSSAKHPLSWSGFCHVKSCYLHLFESKHSVGTRPTNSTELCWEFSGPMSQVWELHLMPHCSFYVLYLRRWSQWRRKKESGQIHSPQGLQSTEWDPGSSQSTVFGGKKQMLFLLLA